MANIPSYLKACMASRTVPVKAHVARTWRRGKGSRKQEAQAGTERARGRPQQAHIGEPNQTSDR